MNRPLPPPAADVLEDLAAIVRAFGRESRLAAIAERAAAEIRALRVGAPPSGAAGAWGPAVYRGSALEPVAFEPGARRFLVGEPLPLGTFVPPYGDVAGIVSTGGERYYMFYADDGLSQALIPADVAERLADAARQDRSA